MYFLVAILVVLCPTGICQTCPKPKGNNCLPTGRSPTPTSCITQVENGTSLTWFEMQKNCAKIQGRLVWLKDDFTASILVATESTLTGESSFKTIDFLVIGLLHSMKGDDLNFWRNADDNDTLSCGTEDTALCLQSPATEKQCNMIGCCWLHGKCQYPEHQILPWKNESDFINTTLISGSSERSCVGLQRSDKGWTFTDYNCTQTLAVNTGYVCEYKCQTYWPDTPSRNVSWPRNDSAKSSSTPSYTNSSETSITKTTNNSTNLTKPYTDRSGNGASNTICLEAVCTITLALLIIEVQRWI